jgi:hypothetical protein
MMAASPSIPQPGIYTGLVAVTPSGSVKGRTSLRSSGGALGFWHIPVAWTPPVSEMDAELVPGFD